LRLRFPALVLAFFTSLQTAVCSFFTTAAFRTDDLAIGIGFLNFVASAPSFNCHRPCSTQKTSTSYFLPLGGMIAFMLARSLFQIFFYQKRIVGRL